MGPGTFGIPPSRAVGGEFVPVLGILPLSDSNIQCSGRHRQIRELSMTSFRTIRGKLAELSSKTLESFAERFRGALICENDRGYEQARRVWNGLIDKRPAMVARCSGVADVVAGINLAREHNLVLAVRGGGHNVSGSGVCDGGLVIDLSAMHAVRVDQKQGTVHVQGGATLADVDRQTQIFGMATAT